MESTSQHSSTSPQLIETGEITKSPFSQVVITLTQEEYVQFKWDANYWKGQYKQVKQKNEDLKLELESAHARIRDLKQRLYGKKTEKGVSKRDKPGMANHTGTPRPRGQQIGSKGTGARTALIYRLLQKSMILLLKTGCAQFVQNLTGFYHRQRIQILLK